SSFERRCAGLLRGQIASNQAKVSIALPGELRAIAPRMAPRCRELLENSGDIAKPLDTEVGDSSCACDKRHQLEHFQSCQIGAEGEHTLSPLEPVIVAQSFDIRPFIQLSGCLR